MAGGMVSTVSWSMSTPISTIIYVSVAWWKLLRGRCRDVKMSRCQDVEMWDVYWYVGGLYF